MRHALWLATLLAGAAPAPPAARAVIVAYASAQDGPIQPGEIPGSKLTHVNFAFAALRDDRLVEHGPEDAASLAALVRVRQANPGLHVLVSVGGWEGSKGFSAMARRPASRTRFVESAVSFLRRHDLDGIDVDWEYPGLPGNGNPHGPGDREGFSALLGELRAALDRDGASRGRRLLLTIAAGAFPEYFEQVDLRTAAASLDLVNLMTYDFRVAGGGDEAGHHANLRAHSSDPRRLSVERAVADVVTAGVPVSKVVLGVPFYSRAWRGVRTQDGLYRDGEPVRGAALRDLEGAPCARVAALAATNGWRRVWDEQAEAPYFWNPGQGLFVSCEDPESLRLKCRFVRERGLAGVMFWEIHSDPTGTLLDALVEGLGAS